MSVKSCRNVSKTNFLVSNLFELITLNKDLSICWHRQSWQALSGQYDWYKRW